MAVDSAGGAETSLVVAGFAADEPRAVGFGGRGKPDSDRLDQRRVNRRCSVGLHAAGRRAHAPAAAGFHCGCQRPHPGVGRVGRAVNCCCRLTWPFAAGRTSWALWPWCGSGWRDKGQARHLMGLMGLMGLIIP